MEYVATTFGNYIPRETMRAQAVDYAEAQTANDMDWQEIQWNLFNGRYASLFPSCTGSGNEVSEEDASEALAIIHEAEERMVDSSDGAGT